MPQVGERKVKGGVLGEWDGSTWRVLAEPGTRKTQDGITAEWSGSTWREVAGETPAQQEASDSPATIGPLGVVAGNAARAAAIRAGEQIATSPNLGRVVRVASKPAANAAAKAIGATHGLPGYLAGEALTNPAVVRGAETGIRGSASFIARVAGSSVGRAITGLPGMLAAMPFSEAGDRPAGETAATTARRQTDFAHQFAEQVNREAGYEVIKGRNTAELLDSIAKYRGAK